jgi:hypothetical protein
MVPWIKKMAEGNANRPAPETLTSEDVDRLSERFKPSWEPDPETAPRPEPARSGLKQTLVGGTVPVTPTVPTRPAVTPTPGPTAPAPVAPVAPGPSVPTATAVRVAATPVAATKPMATVSVGKSTLEVPKAVRHPTLVGIAPQPVRQVSGPPRAAPDDLDWELPAGEQHKAPSDLAQTARLVKAPEPALPPKEEASRVQQVKAEPPAPPPAAATVPTSDDAISITVDVEELPPESKPSGIGQKYVPPDQNAPAIVLAQEVERLEAETRATIEAQHRARSAPTIARMPAVRVASDSSIADAMDEDTVSRRGRGKKGVWLVLALLTLGGGAAAAVALLKKPDAQPANAPPVRENAVAPAADTVAPPPPAPEVPPQAQVPAPTEPAPPVVSVAPLDAEPPKEPAKTTAAAPPVKSPAEPPKRTAAPAARPPKPKPASTAKSGTGSSSRPPRAAVIVRDNPF